MNRDDVDARLRMRVHGAVDPLAPGEAAHRRIQHELVEAASGRAPDGPSGAAGWSGRPIWNLVAAGLVAAVFAGALSTAVVLRNRATGTTPAAGSGHHTPRPSPAVSPTPVVTATPTAATTPSPTPGAQAATLLPAAVPPAPGVTECGIAITRTANGNATPLFCSDGGINVQAWHFYASLSPTSPAVLALGPHATLAQVRATMCADYDRGHLTAPEEESAEQLAARYYLWSLSNADAAPPAWYASCTGH